MSKKFFLCLSMSFFFSSVAFTSQKSAEGGAAAQSSTEEVPASSYTFVKEYGTYSVSFERDPKKKVVAIDVSSCHLLVIRNLSEDASSVRVLSLSHLTAPLLKSSCEGGSSLERSLANILDEFEAVGGDVKTAEFLIYGGEIDSQTRSPYRRVLVSTIHEALELRLKEVAASEEETPRSSKEIGERISQPESHWQRTSRGSRRYLFSKNLLSPLWVEENMKYQPDCHKDGVDFSSHDTFDPRLDSIAKKVKFLGSINKAYYPVSGELYFQTRSLQDKLGSTSPELAETLRVMRPVDNRGVFKPNFCAVCYKTSKLRCPCGKVFYCGKDHQRADWKSHKTEHRKNKKK